MNPSRDIPLPDAADPALWLDRWDRMQERYLSRRRERLSVLAAAIAAARPGAIRPPEEGAEGLARHRQ